MLNKKRQKWMICLLCAALLVSFCACTSKRQPDPGTPDPGTPDPELSSKPLEFFGCSFHDEEGFTFDGFPLMAEYELLEKRMELTETAVKPWIVEQELSNKLEGDTQTVEFYQISVPEYPEAIATLSYTFYEQQFMSGKMAIDFPDYESAVAFLKEKDLEITPFSVEDPEEKFSKTEGEQSCLFQYLDKRDVFIQMGARMTDGQKGEVTLFFSENVLRSGTEYKDSIYFEFREKE